MVEFTGVFTLFTFFLLSKLPPKLSLFTTYSEIKYFIMKGMLLKGQNKPGEAMLAMVISVLSGLALYAQDASSTQGELTIEILKKGEGPTAEAGQEVVVHERMGYLDGTILYSSRQGPPVRFLLGGNQAIKGLDQGIPGMQVGEIRKLIVPPALSQRRAYPSFLSPDSTLVYEIELIDIIPPPDFPPLSARGKIVQQVGFDTITIEYERPSVRGRQIFGHLVPYDTLWKTGAGSGPKIRFSGPTTIENNPVEAGTYALMTIPGEQEWTVIFTRDTTFYMERKAYEPAKEVARFQVKQQSTDRFYEAFTIDIDVVPHNAVIYLSWENTQFSFRVKTSTDETVGKYVEETLLTGKSQNPDLYATAADYYYFGNLDLEKALVLIDIAIKKGNEPWHYRLKMDILERMRRYEEAIAVAQAAIQYISGNHKEWGWDEGAWKRSVEMYEGRIEQLKTVLEK